MASISDFVPPVQTYAEAWLPGHDGIKFYTRTYAASSPQAVVIFVHGFGDHVGRYEWVHAVYASKGITVFAFDQRGFGLTALDTSGQRSQESQHGQTSWSEQFADMEWWLKFVVDQYPGLPVYLMGHSMGGGLVLGFATRSSAPPAEESVRLLAGVIASAPLVLLVDSPPAICGFLLNVASKMFPSLLHAAPADRSAFSRDPILNASNDMDPLCERKGTLRCFNDMISGGRLLLQNDYKNWPADLPILIAHGTADKATSHKASQEFYEKLDAHEKELMLVKDAYHDLTEEPDGVKEKFVDDCVGWILRHVASCK